MGVARIVSAPHDDIHVRRLRQAFQLLGVPPDLRGGAIDDGVAAEGLQFGALLCGTFEFIDGEVVPHGVGVPHQGRAVTGGDGPFQGSWSRLVPQVDEKVLVGEHQSAGRCGDGASDRLNHGSGHGLCQMPLATRSRIKGVMVTGPVSVMTKPSSMRLEPAGCPQMLMSLLTHMPASKV